MVTYVAENFFISRGSAFKTLFRVIITQNRNWVAAYIMRRVQGYDTGVCVYVQCTLCTSSSWSVYRRVCMVALDEEKRCIFNTYCSLPSWWKDDLVCSENIVCCGKKILVSRSIYTWASACFFFSFFARSMAIYLYRWPEQYNDVR